MAPKKKAFLDKCLSEEEQKEARLDCRFTLLKAKSVLSIGGLGPHGPFIGQVTLLPRRGREGEGALGQTGDGGCVTKGTVEWREGLRRERRRESSHSVFVMARSTLSKSKEKRSAAVQRRGRRGPCEPARQKASISHQVE